MKVLAILNFGEKHEYEKWRITEKSAAVPMNNLKNEYTVEYKDHFGKWARSGGSYYIQDAFKILRDVIDEYLSEERE